MATRTTLLSVVVALCAGVLPGQAQIFPLIKLVDSREPVPGVKVMLIVPLLSRDDNWLHWNCIRSSLSVKSINTRIILYSSKTNPGSRESSLPFINFVRHIESWQCKTTFSQAFGQRLPKYCLWCDKQRWFWTMALFLWRLCQRLYDNDALNVHVLMLCIYWRHLQGVERRFYCMPIAPMVWNGINPIWVFLTWLKCGQTSPNLAKKIILSWKVLLI